MDIGIEFIFPFLCNIQIYPIFHLSKYSNIQVVVVGRHDIRQVCIGLALKLYVLPFKYSYIQTFIYSNIHTFKYSNGKAIWYDAEVASAVVQL